MAYSFNGTNQYLTTASAVRTGLPVTVAAWAYTNSITVNQLCAGQVNSNSATNPIMAVVLNGAVAGDPVNWRVVQDAANDSNLNSVQSFSATTWTHVAGASLNNTSHAVFNDAQKTAGTTNSGTTLTSLNRLCIGARARTSTDQYLNGNAAEVAIWAVALTDDEVQSLFKGFKPTRIRPQSLVFYAPLIRDLQDTRGGLAITNNNTATVADHPRVY